MIPTNFRLVRILEIDEYGAILVREYGWDSSTEFTYCFEMDDRFGNLGFYYGHHCTPWDGVSSILVDGTGSADLRSNPVASALLGRPVEGPVAFAGVEVDSSAREGEEPLEVGTLSRDWDTPYLAIDVPLELIAKANVAWFELFRGKGKHFGSR